MVFKINFIGVGFPKTGTTWISKALAEHPKIVFSNKKETNFFLDKEILFCNDINKLNKKYLKEFNILKNKIYGEFSPIYIYNLDALKKIKQLNPNVKILVFIRNPIEQFKSLYHAKKIISMTYSKSINEIFKNKNDQLIEMALMSKHIKNLKEIFPQKNILILKYEDLISSPFKYYNIILDHIGIKNNEFKPLSLNRKINVATKPRSNFFEKIISFFPKTSIYFKKNKFGRNFIKFLKLFRLEKAISKLHKLNQVPTKKKFTKDEEKLIKDFFYNESKKLDY